MKVHILATCRRPDLLPFTSLVFHSLRLGFPTAEICVHLNRLAGDELAAITCHCLKVGASTRAVDTIHHIWIHELIGGESEPFFILDTDVIFYESFERFLPEFQDAALAGWRIPEWHDDFAQAITRARLHTSLLYLNPALLGLQLLAYRDAAQDTPFTPRISLIDPIVLPFKRQAYFYDTCSLLYHAIGGQSFSDFHKDAYFHFNFGTLSDLVLPRLPEPERALMASRRQAILENPALGHGAWREQEEYYANKRA